MPISVTTGPEEPAGEEAGALVSAALTALSWQARFEDDDERCARPEVQAILNAPGDLRRRCIMLVAPDDGRAAGLLLPIIARERAGLAEQDVEALLPLLRRLLDGQQLPAGDDRLRVLVGQVEGTWAALDDDARMRLGNKLEWLVHVTRATSAGKRLRKLVTADTVSRVLMSSLTTPARLAMRCAPRWRTARSRTRPGLR